MTAVPVKSRVHRILRYMKPFRDIGHFPADTPALASDTFGRPLGYYLNPPEELETVWVFENGLFWSDKSGTYYNVPYADIQRIMDYEKTTVELTLELKNGAKVILPVRGNDGRFYDALEWVRFLSRVIELDSSTAPSTSALHYDVSK